MFCSVGYFSTDLLRKFSTERGGIVIMKDFDMKMKDPKIIVGY